MLLNNDRALKEAMRELEMAKSGAITETNAVPHAELRIKLATENLSTTLEAYLQSLEIELEVAKGRTKELQAQLEKLRETSKRSEQKTALENEAKAIVGQLTTMSDELERWKLCLRMLPQSTRVGEVHVQTVETK